MAAGRSLWVLAGPDRAGDVRLVPPAHSRYSGGSRGYRSYNHGVLAMPSTPPPEEGAKYAVPLGAFAVLLLLAGLICAAMVKSGLGYWVELFNGATWPTAFGSNADLSAGSSPSAPYGFWFFAILALRTILNLGVLLTAVFTVCWLVSGGLKRMIMKHIDAVSRMRSAALVTEMLKVLDEANIHPSEEVENRMFDVARQFDETDLGETFATAMRAEPAR